MVGARSLGIATPYRCARPHYGRMTIVLGIIGSFVGGFPGFLIFQHDPMAAGIMGSIVGAIIVLLVYTRFAGRSTARR
ncbi:hypothetical protein C5C22_06365 [Rathayibacter rathayi]|nr:hypothetical protein C5C02_07920 [Rathayibacter rathayi]PPG95309.1 hypothetical protein C5C22_06365 [Rathayibacter rathayi]